MDFDFLVAVVGHVMNDARGRFNDAMPHRMIEKLHGAVVEHVDWSLH